jgi:hypothetical protein
MMLAHEGYSNTTNYRTKIVTTLRDFIRVAQQPYSWLSRLVIEVANPHIDTLHSIELLWIRDRPMAQTST